MHIGKKAVAACHLGKERKHSKTYAHLYKKVQCCCRLHTSCQTHCRIVYVSVDFISSVDKIRGCCLLVNFCCPGFRPIVVCSWTWGLEHLLGEVSARCAGMNCNTRSVSLLHYTVICTWVAQQLLFIWFPRITWIQQLSICWPSCACWQAATQQTLPVAWAWMGRSCSSIAKLHFHSGTGILWKHSYNEPFQLDKPYRERERTHSLIYSLVCGNERNVQKRKSKALSLSTAWHGFPFVTNTWS
jgi:hypothetical protein